ncbi:YciI family protein [Bosea sp. MMO-172]
MIAAVASLGEFQAFSDGDPLVRSGVFERIEIFEWRPTAGNCSK